MNNDPQSSAKECHDCETPWIDCPCGITYIQKRIKKNLQNPEFRQAFQEELDNQYNDWTPKIYVSSKVKHAPMWIEFRNQGHNIISSWIDKPNEISDEEFVTLWQDFIKECSECDFLILYKQADDTPLKGAIIEVGAALAHNATIIIVGDVYEVGTSHHLPNVHFADNLEQAFYMTQP